MIVTLGYITKSLKESPSRFCDVEADAIKRVENDGICDVWVVSSYEPAALAIDLSEQGSRHSAYDPQ